MSSEIQGLFWEPKKKVKRKRRGAANVMPRIKSKWKPTKPSNWPNYKHAKVISLDTETYDPNLLTHGPGYARHDGNLVGISVAVSRSECIYLPMRHEIESNLNHDPEKVLLWAKDNLTTPNQLKIGANIQYDIGWLREEGVIVPGPYLDIQHAEKLIFEHHRTYSLDSLSKRYLSEGKISNKLYNWLAEYYGGKADPSQRKNIYRAPVSYVGPYAEGDAWQPLEIWEKQEKIIKAQNLERILEVESRLIPCLLDMRFRGVRIDLEYTEELVIRFDNIINQQQTNLNDMVGFDINVNASASLAKAYDKLGIKYTYTDKGNPSFTKLTLASCTSDIAKMVVNLREIQKLRSTFIQNALLNKNVNGRIHCSFNQMGARTARMSSSNPNLQQLPSRTKLGKEIRRCFVPDSDKKLFWALDFSQIEMRMLAHYAIGVGAREMREAYNIDPYTDYHDLTLSLIKKITGKTLDRGDTKVVNFSLIYGRGQKALKKALNLKDNSLFNAYHEGLPFAKETLNHYSRIAENTGVITTALGKRTRFVRWECASDHTIPSVGSYAEAFSKWGSDIQRAGCYKATNYLLQGAAAIVMKKAMIDLHESGIAAALRMNLVIHDEVTGSCGNSKKSRKLLKEASDIMNNALRFNVPIRTTLELGKTWADSEEIKL